MTGPMWDRIFKDFMVGESGAYKNDVNVNSNKIFVIEGRNSTKINDNHRITYGAEYIKNTVKGTNLGMIISSVSLISDQLAKME